MESRARDPQPRCSAGGWRTARAGHRLRGGGRSASAEFNLAEPAVCGSVPPAEWDGGTRAAGGLSSAQRAEMAQLRQENSLLRKEIEVLRRGYRNQMVSRQAALDHRNGAGDRDYGGQALTG